MGNEEPEAPPHIDVRAVNVEDAASLRTLDYGFETDRIYTLHVQGRLEQDDAQPLIALDKPALAFELLETSVDPPLYKQYDEFAHTLAAAEALLRQAEGGYIAHADGRVAGAVLLTVETSRSIARIEHIIVGRQFRRYGIGSLLLNCAADWARNNGCWAILLEIENVNYPAIQFYLRNGLEVWSINRHFYPPGPSEHEVALFMGKKLRTGS